MSTPEEIEVGRRNDRVESADAALAKWLFRRFDTEHIGPVSKEYVETWDDLSADDKVFWKHEAAAVRRAVNSGVDHTGAACMNCEATDFACTACGARKDG